MALTGLLSIVVLFGLVGLALMVWALVQILTTDESTWKAAGMLQLVWVAVVLVLPILGSILFIAIARPRLIAHPA